MLAVKTKNYGPHQLLTPDGDGNFLHCLLPSFSGRGGELYEGAVLRQGLRIIKGGGVCSQSLSPSRASV